ncbi:MAG: hypothetical protein DRJ15_09955 [Bacteroidetes bacterium]|nr:MAG: hypothetical protein DRJ15_09955 [Bacteroidota bacterium]
MEKPGGNGEEKTCNLFNRQSVNYPVKFDLKAIIETSIKEEESIKNIEKILKKLKVPYENFRMKHSSGGKYISYTVSVDIDSKKQLEDVYTELKKIPGLKFAL